MNEIDLAKFEETSIRLAVAVQKLAKRDFLAKIALGKEPRIKILRGFRGVGKTTALLQLMEKGALYFSMDNPVVETNTLYEIGKKAAMAGYKALLVDEVHCYPNWKKDAKALYDEFPKLSIALSGSAPLAFEPERRHEMIEIEPLSLGEFMRLQGLKAAASDAWMDEKKAVEFTALNPEIYAHFSKYMQGGGFPAFFSFEEKTLGAIFNSITKSIRQDTAFAANVDGEIIAAMQKAVIFLASSLPGELSINSLSNILHLNRYKTGRAIELLSGMKIVRLIKPSGKGAKLVRQDPKMLFYHPNLRKAVCESIGTTADVGAMREELAAFFLNGRGWGIGTIRGMKKSPDYIIEKNGERIILEIGGKGKGKAQLSEFSGKKLVIREQGLLALGMY
ncbi:MAG: AAA family ATPase [Candidatus Micrarchaeota archaeon]